jgi:hypothetical protein
MTDLRTYFRSLAPAEQECFAARAGTTVAYIRCHLASNPPRKIPRTKLLDGLVSASNGALTRDSLLAYFYSQSVA